MYKLDSDRFIYLLSEREILEIARKFNIIYMDNDNSFIIFEICMI